MKYNEKSNLAPKSILQQSKVDDILSVVIQITLPVHSGTTSNVFDIVD